MKYRRLLVAAVAGVAAVALAAGCSSSKNGNGNSTTPAAAPGTSAAAAPATSAPAPATSAPTSDLGPAIVNGGYTTKGGTVNVLDTADFEHMDPVQNYVTNSGDFGKLIFRTLTVIDDTPGQTPAIKPDLASGLGEPNADASVWTYHLQKGLKFEDGTEITAADVKYAIERSFAVDVYPDGASYMPDTLKNDNGYEGPYKTPDKDLTSVETPDPYTLVFHFQGPQPDCDWMMSEFYTVPVPKDKDTKQAYDKKPVSSGPYMIDSYTPNKSLTLVRNPNWDASTDPNRPALPDKFVFTIVSDAATISARLIADQGADQTAVSIDAASDIQPADVSKLSQPDVQSRFVNGAGPCVYYLSLNTQTIKDENVREAIAQALNRTAILQAFGGPLFGQVPDSFMATSTRGYEPMNLPLQPAGDIDTAKAKLGSTTVPTLNFGVSAGRPQQHAIAVEVQNDLKQIGININITNIPTSSFYTTLRSDNAPDMAVAGWCWDWPTMAAVVPPVLGPDSKVTTWGTNNFAKYFDPTLSKKIADLAVSPDDPATVDQGFNEVAQQIVNTVWPLVPINAALNPAVSGSKIRNFGISTIWSLVDLNILGVAS
ncbi:MAG: ABC transporter substrate-binding protein [Actinomycetia bacterium]|nr:ABC transporter substrate-binding protein [Actinomycetes bacterium]